MNSLFPVFVVEGEGEATKSSAKVNRYYGNVFYTIGEAQLVTIFLTKEKKWKKNVVKAHKFSGSAIF